MLGLAPTLAMGLALGFLGNLIKVGPTFQK
jgi:hypothetical protein